ncbi:MAG: TPM domain-containing protein, partial [Bacteroidota bacterium]
MKKLLAILFLFFSVNVFAQKIPAKPNPPRLVNDYVGMLTAEQANALESKLVAYNDSTSTQIAVIIVGTLDDYEPVEYAVKLGREWGIGGAKFNNGVIILISTGTDGSKRQAFIATGYGIEGVLPDITCKAIVDNELVPYL